MKLHKILCLWKWDGESLACPWVLEKVVPVDAAGEPADIADRPAVRYGWMFHDGDKTRPIPGRLLVAWTPPHAVRLAAIHPPFQQSREWVNPEFLAALRDDPRWYRVLDYGYRVWEDSGYEAWNLVRTHPEWL